jgi:hypothetical protein
VSPWASRMAASARDRNHRCGVLAGIAASHWSARLARFRLRVRPLRRRLLPQLGGPLHGVEALPDGAPVPRRVHRLSRRPGGAMRPAVS